MKKIIAISLCLIVLSLSIFAKPAYKRIYFKNGATKLVVTGKLNGYKGEVNYVIRLRAGQTLKISSNKSITLGVADKSGEDVVDRAANCNGSANISPTVAGDYKISVVECMKADPWKGTFKLFISVK
jgi:hypothetical protein